MLSVYTLAILGAGALGAQLCGIMSEKLGTLTTLAIHSTEMTGLIVVSWLFTRVPELR